MQPTHLPIPLGGKRPTVVAHVHDQHLGSYAHKRFVWACTTCPSLCLPHARGRHGRNAVDVRASAQTNKQPTSPAPQVRAALFTGAYAAIFGVALAIYPKTIFGLLFNPEAVASGWIRVGGILFTLIGWQYLGTAWSDRQGRGAQGFYRATVWSRLALAAAFGLLVAVGEAPPGLLVLAALNLAGAASMHLALRRSVGTDGGSGGGGGGDSGPPALPMKM